MKLFARWFAVLATLSGLCPAQISAVKPAAIDPNSYEARTVASFPHYVPEQQVGGVIRVSGHGSAAIPWMRQLLTAWERDFQRFQPGVKLEYRMFGDIVRRPRALCRYSGHRHSWGGD